MTTQEWLEEAWRHGKIVPDGEGTLIRVRRDRKRQGRWYIPRWPIWAASLGAFFVALVHVVIRK